ncbi:MAG: adenosylhomocysteinase [Fibrobacter sp.]|nr:adenosylhomocysteinase [Fibrobacter sp.]
MLFDEIVNSNYDLQEYPALGAFLQEWSCSRPFEGLRVLVATPIFRNTLLEYRALMAGGAELLVGRAITCDPKIVDLLQENGIEVVTPQQVLEAEAEGEFLDLILDCAGLFAKCHPRYGFVELTRSGVQFFEKCPLPVYVADSGIVKRIETSLGTGEGYFRALAQLGYRKNDGAGFAGKKLLVFGSGKVGSGIALQGVQRGMQVSVATLVRSTSGIPVHSTSATSVDATSGTPVDAVLSSVPSSSDFSPMLLQNDVEILDCLDDAVVTAAIRGADFVVTATGVKNALARPALTEALLETRAVLANMGVEDEFGEAVPESRVLNQKAPLNFILEEPTHLKYIDASLALHAALGERLLQEAMGVIPQEAACGMPRMLDVCEIPCAGPQNPPAELEQRILVTTMQNGTIGPELCGMLGFSPDAEI